MSGPIVRTGTTPKYGESWDRIFGGKKAKASAAKTGTATSKAKATTAKSGPVKAKATTTKAKTGAKKSKKG